MRQAHITARRCMKISKTKLAERLDTAAKHVLRKHPSLGVIPLTAWQEAARVAKLPEIQKPDNPIALAIHSAAITKLEARKKLKPTPELKGWRTRFFDAAYTVCQAA